MKEYWFDKLSEEILKNDQLDLDSVWSDIQRKRKRKKKKRFIFWLSPLFLIGFCSMTIILLEVNVKDQTMTTSQNEPLTSFNQITSENKATAYFPNKRPVEIRSIQKKRSADANDEKRDGSMEFITNHELLIQANGRYESTANYFPLELHANVNRVFNKKDRLTLIVPNLCVEHRNLKTIFQLDTSNKNKNSLNLQLELDVLAGVWFRDLTLKNPEQNNDFLKNRLNSESNKEHLGFRFMFSGKLTNKIILKTGLQLERYTSLFEDVFTTSEVTNVESPAATIEIDKDGNEIVSPGLLELTKKETYELKNYNRHLDVSVPIAFGLRKQLSDQGNLELNLGLTALIYTSNRGLIINSDIADKPYLDLSNIAFKRQGLISTQIGLSYGYICNDQLGLRVGLEYSRDLNNRYLSQGIFREKRSSFFSNIGLTYKI